MCLSEVGKDPSITEEQKRDGVKYASTSNTCALRHTIFPFLLKTFKVSKRASNHLPVHWGRLPTYHDECHLKRLDPGWLFSGNLASTSTELPSGGCTAYLQKHYHIVKTIKLWQVYFSLVCNKLCVPGRGVLAELFCALWSTSGLEPEEVDGPGLLSMETSDTVKMYL